jgi:hypothetical protein
LYSSTETHKNILTINNKHLKVNDKHLKVNNKHPKVNRMHAYPSNTMSSKKQVERPETRLLPYIISILAKQDGGVRRHVFFSFCMCPCIDIKLPLVALLIYIGIEA